jgi:AcrR family transcriptional regulator
LTGTAKKKNTALPIRKGIEEPAPSGKRAANARAIRAGILSAATMLFTKVGYENTTVAQILAKSDISVGTFYKYFDSKQAILLAIVQEERLRSRSKVALAVAADVRNPSDYLLGIVLAALDPSEADEVPILWREILAATISLSADREISASLTVDRDFYTGQVLSGLQELIRKGLISPEIPIRQVSEVLYCICSHEFQDFVCGRYATRTAFIAQIRALIGVIVKPWQSAKRKK